MRVTEISGEGDEVTRDRVWIVAALFKGANREGMAEIVNAGRTLAGSGGQAGRSGQSGEHAADSVVAKGIAFARKE
jgi:hypothetical protein